jgi:hypothetical protein
MNLFRISLNYQASEKTAKIDCNTVFRDESRPERHETFCTPAASWLTLACTRLCLLHPLPDLAILRRSHDKAERIIINSVGLLNNVSQRSTMSHYICFLSPTHVCVHGYLPIVSTLPMDGYEGNQRCTMLEDAESSSKAVFLTRSMK